MDERDMDYWFGKGGVRHAVVNHATGTRPVRREGWRYEEVESDSAGAVVVLGTMSGLGNWNQRRSAD
jgi:hypothetical protein